MMSNRRLYFFGKNLGLFMKYVLAVAVAWAAMVSLALLLTWLSEHFGAGSVLCSVVVILIIGIAWVNAGLKADEEEKIRTYYERGGK